MIKVWFYVWHEKGLLLWNGNRQRLPHGSSFSWQELNWKWKGTSCNFSESISMWLTLCEGLQTYCFLLLAIFLLNWLKRSRNALASIKLSPSWLGNTAMSSKRVQTSLNLANSAITALCVMQWNYKKSKVPKSKTLSRISFIQFL